VARVNVDESVQSDSRWKLLARDLGAKVQHVWGEALAVWFACYARRSAVVSAEEIDMAAGRDGFAQALCKRGLADETPDGVRVRGVEERIGYLMSAAENGRLGGLARRRKETETTKGNGSLQAPLSLPPALSPALSLSPDQKTNTRARTEGSSPELPLPLTLEPDPVASPDPAELSAQKYIEWFNRVFHHTYDWQTYVEPIRGLQSKFKATDRQLQEVAIYLRASWEHVPKMRSALKPSTLLRPTEWKARLSEATEWMAADCPPIAPVYPTMTGNEPEPPLAAPRRGNGGPTQPGAMFPKIIRGVT
jgi:hypothetical protein